MELMPSWTKAGSWTLGRDPLGMQATSVRMYRTLVPGLTNVTNRLRYYSFYCWVIQLYEQMAHSGDENKWRIFIRRAEALYALACYVADHESSDGLAGGLWASAFRQSLPTDRIDLRPHTDRPGKGGQYLKAVRGNFGQFYIASMTEVGLLLPSGRIPVVSDPLGRDMADAFGESIGIISEQISNVIETGITTPDQLFEIGSQAHPSRIPTGSREMVLLRDFLLEKNANEKKGKARQASAWLVLDILRQGGSEDDEAGFRQAFYNRILPDQSPYHISGSTVDRWKAYQANELCHIACETVLNAMVAQLTKHPLGIDPDILLTELLKPILEELDAWDKPWKEWAEKTGKKLSGNESALADPILTALNDLEMASDSSALSKAMEMIATLWFRWGTDETAVFENIQRHAGKGGRSLAGLIKTINTAADKSVFDVSKDLIRRHLIADHLTIAGKKLAASGTFTYHFTLSDGVMSDGRVTTYGYTNPRLRNLIRFLKDAKLYNGMDVTPDGLEFLNEIQPV